MCGDRYGKNQSEVNRYFQRGGDGVTGGSFQPWESKNFFLQNVVFGDPANKWDQLLCTSCPTAPCQLPGRYRLNYTTTCGPSCLLEPELCTEPSNAPFPPNSPFAAGKDNQGCSQPCEPTAHGSYTSGSPTLGDKKGCAPFLVCALGYHRSNDNNSCESCLLAPGQTVAQYCGSPWFYLLPQEQCSPTTRTIEMCKPCPIVAHASLASTRTTPCAVVCDRGYYFANQSCVPCTKNLTACPAGWYADVATCDLNQTRPRCEQCTAPVDRDTLDFLTDGGTSATGCRVRCKVGYHTKGTVGADAEGFVIGNESLAIGELTACAPCVTGDSRSCASNCSRSQYRNLSVQEGQVGSCVHCRMSLTCGDGYYAPTCSGAETLDAQCVPCPRLTMKSIQYVSYAALWSATLLQRDHCPTACINNHVLSIQGGAELCSPCPHDTYAHWNATVDGQGRIRSDRCLRCMEGYATSSTDKVSIILL